MPRQINRNSSIINDNSHESNTGNSTHITGNVDTGDFVGRDQLVQGDFVHGDKVTGDIVMGDKVIIQRLDPADARNQRNHAALRKMVRSFWIDGVLKSSLYNEVLIRLNMEKRPDAVDNRPWDLILQQPAEEDRTLPEGIPIIDVFDQMNQLLLILGEPGSGKTTMLLELADALLDRAEADPTHPTPVVFNLSSWAERGKSIEDWLVDELCIKYRIPKRDASKWVQNDELLLLLDGLDEVSQEHCNDCVEAINLFLQEHLVWMTICSRTSEYESLITELKLHGAVLLQPLTLNQVNNYLNTAGAETSLIKTVIQQNSELQDMATSPLLLNIMSLAYNGITSQEMSSLSNMLAHRPFLFSAYIKRMFTHRGSSQLYPVHYTIQCLRWLSTRLSQDQQTVFLVDQMQPNWLNTNKQLGFYTLVIVIANILTVGPIIGLPVGFVAWMDSGIFVGLVAGFSVCILFGLLFGLFVAFGRAIFIGLTLVMSFTTVVTIAIEESFIAESMFTLGCGILPGLAVGTYLGITRLQAYGPAPISAVAQIKWSLKGIIMAIAYGILSTKSIPPGFTSEEVKVRELPNQTIRQSGRNALYVSVSVFSAVSIINSVINLGSGWLQYDFNVPLFFATLFGLLYGGGAVIKHYSLRFSLHRANYLPFFVVPFLDYCRHRILLHKVGGGYIFIHRLLMEHFASLTDEDIERLAVSIDRR